MPGHKLIVGDTQRQSIVTEQDVVPGFGLRLDQFSGGIADMNHAGNAFQRLLRSLIKNGL